MSNSSSGANEIGSNPGSSSATIEQSKRARSINSKTKFVEHDNSLFLDGKKTVPHDKSFTEHLDEKNRMTYQHQGVHNISQTELMKKRHNSNERGSKI